MRDPVTTWFFLEIAKLLVSVLTPLSVVALGWFVSRELKRLEHSQWTNQKLIEKRLAVFDTIAPPLNKLFCFYTWVGNWKSTSPGEVLKTKRDLDAVMHVYRHVLGNQVFERYDAFMALLFETYNGPGMDARLRTRIASRDGDRRAHATYEWRAEWADRFATDDLPEKPAVRRSYLDLMYALGDSVGAAVLPDAGENARGSLPARVPIEDAPPQAA